MKISREQKERNRKSLLSAAIEVMAEEGIREATMRKMAQRAGVSEPVIYNYFPTKDHLLVSYFAEIQASAFAKATAISEFQTQPFADQIQIIFDAHLALFEENRSFVTEAFGQLFFNVLSGSFTHVAQQKKDYITFVDRLLGAAVASEEFAAPASHAMLVELLWDFHVGMIYYWTKDASQGQLRTLQVLEKSLALMNEILHSNVLGRLADLFYFFVREHFISSIDKLAELTPLHKEMKSRYLNEEQKPTPTKRKTRAK